MSELVIAISEFCGELECQYYSYEEPHRSAAGKEFDKMSLILREAVIREIKKNDACYEEAVKLVSKACKDLEQVRKGTIGVEQFIVNITGIADQLDRLIGFFLF